MSGKHVHELSLKWMNVIVGSALLFASCSITPSSNPKPSVFPRIPSQTTESITEGALSTAAETPGNGVYLPIITSAPDSCQQTSFGIMITEIESDDWITPADVVVFANDQVGIKGMVSAGAPSEGIRDQVFEKLPGWTRSFIRGTYDQLASISSSAGVFRMEDMYECIAYGPESAHQAGQEALEPLVWVPEAKEIADTSGKCLIYGPAVLDYERMATPAGESQPDQEKLSQLISQVSPYVDIWMVQLAKYQRWADGGHDDLGNPFTMDDFTAWIKWWVDQIKTANPGAKVWTQLGVGVYDPLTKACQPPQPPEYILNYRARLVEAGVNGIFAAPSQPCLMSSDPQDREYYLQTLGVIQQSIEMACTR